jgi:RNA polymerase sigma factor (sigma-70 family)
VEIALALHESLVYLVVALLMGLAAEFCTTHWSVVRLAGASPCPEAAAALERLCGSYWRPVYAYIRRRGYPPEDAEDLTQEFFAELLDRRSLTDLDRSRGKFRSFLVACLNHFLAKDWRARRAQKRGGGRTFVPVDSVEGEEHYLAQPETEAEPAVLFDREWAIAILDQAMSALRSEQGATKGGLFEELVTFLTAAGADVGYAEAAHRLRMTPGAVATAVHRLRHRYRELVRQAVTQTVSTPLELEEEMRYLLQVLGA